MFMFGFVTGVILGVAVTCIISGKENEFDLLQKHCFEKGG